ncbi:MAG TPA: copper-binding protein, partial [Candidatus Nitrosotenuis sp.]|nr:copper-binding protein [Candidatus Nitrosotenuis sp.]
MKYLFLLALLPALTILPVFAEQQQVATDKGTLLVNISFDPEKPVIGDLTKMKVEFINPKTNE